MSECSSTPALEGGGDAVKLDNGAVSEMGDERLRAGAARCPCSTLHCQPGLPKTFSCLCLP